MCVGGEPGGGAGAEGRGKVSCPCADYTGAKQNLHKPAAAGAGSLDAGGRGQGVENSGNSSAARPDPDNWAQQTEAGKGFFRVNLPVFVLPSWLRGADPNFST